MSTKGAGDREWVDGRGHMARRGRGVFEVLSTVSMLLLAAAALWVVWQGRSNIFDSAKAGSPLEVAIPTTPVEIGESATLGSALAEVAIIEYADFECPACRRFAVDIEPALRRDYIDQGRVLLVFKNFPLPIHPTAAALAKGAWCAGRQGRFWGLHDVLFGAGPKQGESILDSEAAQAGLELTSFNQCRVSSDAADHIDKEKTQAVGLKIPATPSFLFGRVLPGRRVQVAQAVVGGRPVGEFQGILDRILISTATIERQPRCSSRTTHGAPASAALRQSFSVNGVTGVRIASSVSSRRGSSSLHPGSYPELTASWPPTGHR